MRNIEAFTPDFEENREVGEEREIGIIEKSLLDSAKKLDLALLALDRKKVAVLGDCRITETAQARQQILKSFTEELEEIKKILTELEYYYDEDGIHEDRDEGEEVAVIDFSVIASKHEKYLQQAQEAEKRGNDKALGSLLGYPSTAVASYKSEEALDFEVYFKTGLSEDERKELEEEGVLKFLGFKPSKNHWREELEEARMDQALIKEKAPHLYGEIMALQNKA